MEDNIIRKQTEEEKRDYEDLVFNEHSTKNKFYAEVANKGQEAIKKGLPFAEKPCKDEFNDYYNSEMQKSIRKNGYLVASEIKPIKIDFSKYMDLKNFEVLDEGEKNDEYLTKTNPGLNVMVKYTTYRFKGYHYTYTVMEDKTSAIQRARKKLKEI